MNLAEILRRAEQAVLSHRHDRDTVTAPSAPAETSLAHAARIYTAITGTPMSESEALTFMQCVKLARAARDPKFNPDHFIDLIGYTALAGVARHQEQCRGED